MKCSKKATCPFPCNSKLPQHFASSIELGLDKVIRVNALPDSISTKIAATLIENLDAADFCNKVTNYFEHVTPHRERIFDRLIVHQFEEYYEQLINTLSERKKKSSHIGELFDIIPRGNCLNLFLSLIKEHCMGKEQIKRFSQDIDLLTLSFSDEAGINWDELYTSEEYESCMTEVFSIIFRHFVQRDVPIPALNLKLDNKHQAERINRLLRHMSKLWLNEHNDYSI